MPNSSARVCAMRLSNVPRLLGVALAAALALAGCSSPDKGGLPGPTGSAGSTRTVTDAKGTPVQVPAQPRRVVALSEPTLDGTLALGLTPVGTTNGRGQSSVPNYLTGRAEGIPVVANIGSPDLEKI